ncbi:MULTISPECIES: MauE/DoxX family redox-associated membrane protein [Pseudomonas]|uniref:Methylamine utilization protein MauE n=1 Tax=Pseudomonas segetis TaxID=298908 RepID=A0A239HQZ9_9PSED|nr:MULTISPECIES: MauE/DoxX family redox-associated membrane protein [Pseudomonas]SNS83508.1 Methylamine utilisation protein MauE [Pseudomonas segetis]
MQPDPIFVIACALTIAVILASAATHKLRAPSTFANQVEDYQLLPKVLVSPLSRLIPVLELVIALGLLIPASRALAAPAAAALLMGYAAAIAINLWRGRSDIDCGCSGPDQAQPLRPILLARNAVLALLAIIASLSAHSRDLGAFDAFVVIAAAAVALLIYSAAEGLLANGPRLAKLIGR